MRVWLVLILLALSSLARATSMLDELLHWQRQSYPAAWVTSGFWDPRGISHYRSRPGLHLGYDIAMPWGSRVLAAWPGSVVALIPWAEGEWGVAVEHADGTRATYGHLKPLVEVGQKIQAGQVVGTVATDHVDVKMLDARGMPWDFGLASSGRSLVLVQPSTDPKLAQLQGQLRGILRQGPGPIRARPRPRQAGKATASFETLAEEFLKKGWKADWSKQDRQALEAFRIHLEGVERRYELGLIARKEVERVRREWSLWSRLFNLPAVPEESPAPARLPSRLPEDELSRYPASSVGAPPGHSSLR